MRGESRKGERGRGTFGNFGTEKEREDIDLGDLITKCE